VKNPGETVRVRSVQRCADNFATAVWPVSVGWRLFSRKRATLLKMEVGLRRNVSRAGGSAPDSGKKFPIWGSKNMTETQSHSDKSAVTLAVRPVVQKFLKFKGRRPINKIVKCL
jgi:hypothetical protein